MQNASVLVTVHKSCKRIGLLVH